jgi:hypothetical protein
MNTLSLIKLMVMIGSVAGISAAHANPGSANLPETDVQQYEQTYEDWVQTLVQNVAPKNPATVLLKFEYGNNPDQLQTYEELKASNHLPGLPDVSDPHATRPYENAVSALVTKQKIKIIFEKSIPATKTRLLNEILTSKLHLNTARGDGIEFEQLSATETKTASSTNSFNRKNAMMLLAAAIAVLAALSVRKNAKTKTKTEINEAPKATPPAMTALTLNAAAPAPRVQSINLILQASPKVMHQVIRSEKAENLARAFLNIPTAVSGALLNICTPEQRKEILTMWNIQTVSAEQSRFSQLLIAARIHRENEKQAIPQIALFSQVNLARSIEKNLKADAEAALREVREVQVENTNLNISPISEVSETQFEANV